MLRGKTSNIRNAFLLLICNFLKKLKTKSNHFFGTSTYIWDTNHHQFIWQADHYLKYCSLSNILYVTGQNPWESTIYIYIYICVCVQKEYSHDKSLMGFEILRSWRSRICFFKITAGRTVFNFSCKTSFFCSR